MIACKIGNENVTNRNDTQAIMFPNANAVPFAFCLNTSLAYMPGIAPTASANKTININIQPIQIYEIIELLPFEINLI